MMSIKLPFLFGKKSGLLINDTDVELISWKKGDIERVAVFSNDDAGLTRFFDFIEKNERAYRNTAFSILTNVIGEDYRIEKVAHLFGKYKTDFHNRRMQQLFRGVSLCMSFVQGREERGRREDIVLFYGMLTEGKVLPWMQAARKNPTHDLVGVYAISFINTQLLKYVNSDWRRSSNLLMTIHEKGLLRQTHYDQGHVRFSRVSKISDESAASVAAAIRKELERTIQYLHSLKISVAGGLDIQFICPANMVGQLRELVQSSEKIRFHFHDASALAQTIGLRSALGDLGRDSSLSLHILFTHLWFRQLASFNHIRYYWLKTVSVVASLVLVIYGLIGGINVLVTSLNVLEIGNVNQELVARRDRLQREYDEAAQFEDPPSESSSIEAVTRTFRVFSNLSVAPGQLIYYFARGYEKNKRLNIYNLRWYLGSSARSTQPEPYALIAGSDIYQVLEVSGEFLPVPGETYLDVANRANVLLDSFEQRSDIQVEGLELPKGDLGDENLSGQLTEDYAVDAARTRTFRLRIVWKQYDRDRINKLIDQNDRV